jgi:AAA family ATP:ADP antiporter
MSAGTEQATVKGLFARLIGPERHEYSAVGWSFLYFFCLLSAYYVMRPMREAMAVASGPETIPYLFTGTFIAMLVATPIFGWIASRYARRRFLPWVYYFFVVNILLFYAAFTYMIERDMDYVWLGRVFFIWISIFNLYVVSVFWSFMADIYTKEQGRRLFGMISAGGSLGAVIGGAATSLLVTRIGFENLLPVSAALLMLAVFCIGRLRHWVEIEHRDEIESTAASERPLGGNPLAGITHVLGSRYFLAMAVASAIASLLGTALYMFGAELVEEAITDANERTRFFSNMNLWQNVLAVLGQFFVVRHVVGRFGLGASLVLLPLLSVVGFVWLALEPTLMVVAVLTVLRRALGFAFSKPTSDMLYSVVSDEEKYKAKNFIDTTLYRGGDLVGTWGIRALSGFGIAGISLLMLPFALVWALIALWLGRDYERRDHSTTGN